MTTVMTKLRADAELLYGQLDKRTDIISVWSGTAIVTEAGEDEIIDIARKVGVAVSTLTFTVSDDDNHLT